MILTPEYGPRVRFGSVITAAPLPADAVRDDDLCIRCMRCVRMCPSSALSNLDYPEGLTDKFACATWSAALHKRYISPCGICIKVCPVGEDRIFYDRNDLSIYEQTTGENRYQRSWDHVRRYGGKSIFTFRSNATKRISYCMSPCRQSPIGMMGAYPDERQDIEGRR